MRREVFDDYCQTMFSILLEIWDKRKDDIAKRDNY